ncbi:MAG: hypothetical protein K2X81_24800 [Candidatus Obscuribacterales bacterium]|nr:hypothetical protein [Candidatus Obscuribacterales bacterium]
MPSVASRVREFANNIADNVMFTTSQLLEFGSRNAIDIQLCRMVQSGVIKRLAAGVFIKPAANKLIPSACEIAKTKAERFGKIIAQRLNLLKPDELVIFYTDGCRSSFRSVHGRLYFKHQAPRKLKQNKPVLEQNSAIQSMVIFSTTDNSISSGQTNSESKIEDLQLKALELSSRLADLLGRLFKNTQQATHNC